MDKLGIIVNEEKDKNFIITNLIIKWLEDKKITPLLTNSIAEKLQKNKYGEDIENIYKNAEIILVLGGDGTILNVARESCIYEKPILGVNLGNLGFLAEIEVKELIDSLELISNNKIVIEDRIMLEASIKNSNTVKNFIALNDIIITRGTLSRIANMNISINDNLIYRIYGDGIIVATPTGSTAYSLSAGGPIVNPRLSLMILTPICPHSISNRSIVISDKESIRIDFLNDDSDIYLNIDGQNGCKIMKNDYIIINKSFYKTKLIKLPNKNFYEVLRRKLSER